jgi:hypothetical protein
MQAAIKLIPAETKLLAVDGVGHELLGKSRREQTIELIVSTFLKWIGLVETQHAAYS